MKKSEKISAVEFTEEKLREEFSAEISKMEEFSFDILKKSKFKSNRGYSLFKISIVPCIDITWKK